MVESRKDERAVVSLVARYRSPTVFEFVEEECYDLSRGGMFIKSPNPAPAGTLLKLECLVDRGPDNIRGIARVVWVREREGENAPRGMGVKFIKLEPGSPELIEGILDKVGSLEESGVAPAARVEPAAPASESRPEPEPEPEPKPKPAEAVEEASEEKPEPVDEQPPEVPAPAPAQEPAAAAAEEQAAPEEPEPEEEERAEAAGQAEAEAAEKEGEEQQPPAEEAVREPEERDRFAELARTELEAPRERTTIPVPGRGEERPTALTGWVLGLGAAGVLLLLAVSLGVFDGSEQETTEEEIPVEEPAPPEEPAPEEPVETAPQSEELMSPAAEGAEPGEPAQEAVEPVTEQPAPEPVPEPEAAPPKPEPEPAPVKRAAKPAPKPKKKKAPRKSAAARKRPAPAPKPAPAAKPAPTPEPAAAKAEAPAEQQPVKQTPFEAATECIAKGDNPCVIRALEGKARTEREYRLLIETYRAMGNTQEAIKQMAVYVKKFPSGRRAGTYGKMLERSGQ